jgi:hypothetical protein
VNIDAWWHGSWQNARASSGVWLGLLRKELRLQTVTFILASTLLLPLLLRAMAQGEASMLEGSAHLGVVLAAFTCLLAGAVAFAEERRLGTLEAQVLQPVSRGGQWLLKAGVAALPAALALLVAGFVCPPDLPEFRLAVLLGTAGFCFCLHASSGASHALRALLSSTLLGLAVWMISMLGTSVGPYSHTLLSGLTYKDQLHNPGAWIAEVTRLSATELDRARWLSSFVRPGSGYPDVRDLSAQLQSISAFHLMPLVALLLCWRNFAQPAHAPGRILRQQFRILVITVGTSLALVVGGILVARAAIRAQLLVETRQHLDIEASLSPTQLKLRRHVVSGLPGSPVISPSHSVVMHVLHPDSRGEGVKPDAVPAPWSDGEPGKRVRWMRRDFPLPLSPSDRQLLIDWGSLAPAHREGLIREAAGK